jgi:hypothetical protein
MKIIAQPLGRKITQYRAPSRLDIAAKLWRSDDSPAATDKVISRQDNGCEPPKAERRNITVRLRICLGCDMPFGPARMTRFGSVCHPCARKLVNLPVSDREQLIERLVQSFESGIRSLYEGQ